MDDIQKALMETFQSETRELLEELETALLELEGKPGNKDLVDRVFRALHTIKGNGGMFGFDGITRFTHDLENVYDLVRNGNLAIDRQIIDMTLTARDIIAEMMKDPGCEDEPLQCRARELLEAFGERLPGKSAETARPARMINETPLERKTYRIRFRPEPEIFRSGTNPLLLIRELGELGQMTTVPVIRDLPALGDLDPERSYFSWDIILTTEADINSIRDVFIFVEDRCELRIDTIDEEGSLEGEEDHIRLGDILIERGDLSREDLQDVLYGKVPLGQELVKRDLVREEAVTSALVEQQVLREVRTRKKEEEAATSVRVASGKLDSLVDLVGELVTVQARLARTASQIVNPELTAISEMVEMLTWELRDNAFSLRMVPIGTTFSTFRRTVRDLAAEMGKEVELVAHGGETELDKNVIEQLRDPLVHLIRNSIDHGIESPEDREAAGKPRVGSIILSASQAGADVLIRVADDGAGMDEEAILAKARQMKLIGEGESVGRKELFSLVFEPAFSTARNVTSVSGRGVGMDVVRKHVESLRGSIEVDSYAGVGTDIHIRLPLTLAIIEGLQVEIAGEKYIFPLSTVEECVELKREDSGPSKGRDLANVRGELIPYVSLRDWFAVKGERKKIEQIVIVSENGRRVGFVVDSVIGEHQTVIKSLGVVYRNVDGISGASILGDGTVALILDAPQLLAIVEGQRDVPNPYQGSREAQFS